MNTPTTIKVVRAMNSIDCRALAGAPITIRELREVCDDAMIFEALHEGVIFALHHDSTAMLDANPQRAVNYIRWSGGYIVAVVVRK